MKPLLNPRAMHSAPHDPMPMLRRLQQNIEAQQREMAALTVRIAELEKGQHSGFVITGEAKPEKRNTRKAGITCV